MEAKALNILIQSVIVAAEKRIAEFLANAEDQNNNNGNCAICIVDAAGNVHGKMFRKTSGTARNTFSI